MEHIFIHDIFREEQSERVGEPMWKVVTCVIVSSANPRESFGEFSIVESRAVVLRISWRRVNTREKRGIVVGAINNKPGRIAEPTFVLKHKTHQHVTDLVNEDKWSCGSENVSRNKSKACSLPKDVMIN